MKPERDLARLQECLREVRYVLDWSDDRLYLRDEQVSGWSPAQHVDHLLRTLDHVLGAILLLEQGTDPQILHGGHPTFVGRMMLLTGWIPRGRGQAPDAVKPAARPVRHGLRSQLEATESGWREKAARAKDWDGVRGRTSHRVLGAFRAADWVRFALVHTRHHMSIIRDIDQRRAIGVPNESPAAAADGECSAGASTP